MPIKDLRQDTLKPLPYLGTKNAQCIYWDRQLPGFGVRVFPSGRRMFVCSYRVQGRKRLATLGRGDVLRLDVARKKAVSYLGQVAAGLQDLRIHDLRGTVGSWLVRDGASLHLVGSALNHKDQKTTAGYAYFQTKERHKALDKHGRNVVDFASRLPTASADVGDRLSEPSAIPPPSRGPLHTFTREALYKLVWSESPRTLSKRLGISDVGLAKVCRRANIPTPDRGYWARVAAGQGCEKTTLPLLGPGAAKPVKFRGRRPARLSLIQTNAAAIDFIGQGSRARHLVGRLTQ